MAHGALLRYFLFCWCFGGAFGGGEASADGVSTSLISNFAGSDTTTTLLTSSQAGTSIVAPITTQPVLGTATCPSGTVNYITHTLPQQCLRTNRVPAASLHVDGSITAPTPTSSNRLMQTADASHTSSNNIESQPLNPHEGLESAATQSIVQDGKDSTASSASGYPPLPTQGSSTTSSQEEETDSPLDNVNFLSFEEWKKQNLAKVGQSPENIGKSQASPGAQRTRPDLSNALDVLGEESEIDLDFTGFGGATKQPESVVDGSVVVEGTDIAATDSQSRTPLTPRSKDAGKTCKERTNYASFDCAATVLKSNKECKSASSILVENKDSYLLNICSAESKHIIIELCDDILVDTLVLANYEFFSSSFRHFRVSVSDRYPVKADKWKDLGTFEARNTREIQAFLVENPLIWARYLKIDFLTHYGSEYYCPVSLLRVHGTTMLEEFRHQEDIARGEDDEVQVEVPATEPNLHDPPASDVPEQSPDTLAYQAQVVSGFEKSNTTDAAGSQIAPSMGADTVTQADLLQPLTQSPPSVTAAANQICLSNRGTLMTTCGISALEETTVSHSTHPSETRVISSIIPPASNSTMSSGAPTESAKSSTSATAAHNSGDFVHPPVGDAESASNRGGSIVVNATTSTLKSADSLPPSASPSNAMPQQKSDDQGTASASVSTNRTASATLTTAQQPQPSTQESFFKSVHKRLQQLESNSTLSLKYIEEQSRILRDAFSKVEKRQVAKTSTFLSTLNQTVMVELQGFRQAYDQLWQSTVIELEGQRQQNQREMLALSARLTMVADELVWQKRMGILQSTLLLLCLGLALFGRSGTGYLEMPIMQQMVNRSTSALRMGFESPPVSPSPDSRSPVSLFRKRLWRSSAEPLSENLTDSDKEGPEVHLEPPTPPRSSDQLSEDEVDMASDEALLTDKKQERLDSFSLASGVEGHISFSEPQILRRESSFTEEERRTMSPPHDPT